MSTDLSVEPNGIGAGNARNSYGAHEEICQSRLNSIPIGTKSDRQCHSTREAQLMLDIFQKLIANQYEASLCTLNACVEKCPENAWRHRW